MPVYAKALVMEILGQFLAVLSYLAINYKETGQAKCYGHNHVPQTFVLGCNCLPVLTLNYVAMLVKIVE